MDKMNKQKQKYPAIAKNIIDISDIILEVLDARFIEQTRNKELENEIIKNGKKLIFILNKSDLINQKKSKENGFEKIYPYVFVSCVKRKGIKKLRDLIKREAKKIDKPVSKEIKGNKIQKSSSDKVQVGIIGYPNTGKSSLINLLVGKASAGTGAEAGFTKGLQKIKLTPEIILIDSPGVIPSDIYSEIKKEKLAQHTIVGGRSSSQVKNPEVIVAEIMKENRGVLEKYYKIRAKGDAEILIEKLGRQKNFLAKGGEINFDKTARLILKNWQEGKIKI